ncbi:MAG: DMT family transporter [Chloroflexi bacterium]|nr:DMT family transporter [Chloroflexota bacterium]
MGEIAALTTALCWSLTSIQFTLASRRIGSGTVNRTRLALTVVYLSLAHMLLYGELWPTHVETFRLGWLGLSGTAGLVLGDACLFQSFVLIGPRRGMLLMTLVPVISTLLAWGWLGETLHPVEVGAILLAVGGVAWVVSERQQEQEMPDKDKRRHRLGILLGLGGASGQALGLVMAKQGLVGDFAPLSATLIRATVAVVVIWFFALVRGHVGETWRAWKDKKALLPLLGGSLTGPFIGVWLSMIAVQRAHVGIASTLMALSPIIMIPMTRLVFDEKISPRSITGTVVALAGAAMIFLT